MELIQLYQQRSEQALTNTRSIYGNLVRHIIRGILNDPMDIEECENDTYLSIWNSIPPNVPENFQAYLAAVARNTACKRRSYLSAEKRCPNAVVSLDELEQCIADDSARVYTDTELSDAINGFLGTLRPMHRKIFLKRYWQSMTEKEIAAESGLTRVNVAAILSRTRKKLHRYLKERGLIV